MSQESAVSAKAFSSVRLLPKDFVPSIDEVVVGRGKKVTNHCGNHRFRELIGSKIDEYLSAQNKAVKSSIIFDVLQQVKKWSPATGGFVKQDAKAQRWFAVEDATARNTAAQAFRDANSSSYKSSKRSKQQRRMHRKISCSEDTEPLPVNTNTDAVMPVQIRMQMPAFTQAFPAIPRQLSLCTADMAPSASQTQASSSLEDILDSALEVAVDDVSLSASLEGDDHFCNFASATDLNLEALWDNLEVPAAANENPFEPTPIAPTSVLPILPTSTTAVPSFQNDLRKQSFPNGAARQTLSLQWAMTCRRA